MVNLKNFLSDNEFYLFAGGYFAKKRKWGNFNLLFFEC